MFRYVTSSYQLILEVEDETNHDLRYYPNNDLLREDEVADVDTFYAPLVCHARKN